MFALWIFIVTCGLVVGGFVVLGWILSKIAGKIWNVPDNAPPIREFKNDKLVQQYLNSDMTVGELLAQIEPAEYDFKEIYLPKNKVYSAWNMGYGEYYELWQVEHFLARREFLRRHFADDLRFEEYFKNWLWRKVVKVELSKSQEVRERLRQLELLRQQYFQQFNRPADTSRTEIDIDLKIKITEKD